MMLAPSSALLALLFAHSFDRLKLDQSLAIFGPTEVLLDSDQILQADHA